MNMKDLSQPLLTGIADATLYEISQLRVKADKELFENIKEWASELKEGEVMYVIEEMKHIGPTVTDMEVNLTLSMEYQALFVPENRDPTSQILAMMMGKEYTMYGPITRAMLEEIKEKDELNIIKI